MKLIRPFSQFRATCDFLYLRFEEEPDDFDLAEAIQGSILDMYMRSALEHALEIRRLAPGLELGDALVEFEKTLNPEDAELAEAA